MRIGTLDVDDIFTKTGSGRFELTNSGTLAIGNVAASSVEAGTFRISDGNQLTIGDVTILDDTEVHLSGTLLHVLDDYLQDGGSLSIAAGARILRTKTLTTLRALTLLV